MRRREPRRGGVGRVVADPRVPALGVGGQVPEEPRLGELAGARRLRLVVPGIRSAPVVVDQGVGVPLDVILAGGLRVFEGVPPVVGAVGPGLVGRVIGSARGNVVAPELARVERPVVRGGGLGRSECVVEGFGVGVCLRTESALVARARSVVEGTVEAATRVVELPVPVAVVPGCGLELGAVPGVAVGSDVALMVAVRRDELGPSGCRVLFVPDARVGLRVLVVVRGGRVVLLGVRLLGVWLLDVRLLGVRLLGVRLLGVPRGLGIPLLDVRLFGVAGWLGVAGGLGVGLGRPVLLDPSLALGAASSCNADHSSST
ncbi:hypothetical protein GCM10025870_21310 [Agromyces marinus]|uniref:Uncharacterized protein n=1 Tax=Agromyces marinus TaxID=1389020 RepID=A0ABM8H2M8_9MICO|nr:hypothetical protein [Agromyces marinus]BDZ55058.1 hypothetical protein GCM10025870_21310 [Agromyces marinus]